MHWSIFVVRTTNKHCVTGLQKLLETIDKLEAELRAVKGSSGVLSGTVVSRLTSTSGVAGAPPRTSGLSSLGLAAGFSAIGATVASAVSPDAAERLERLTRENRSLKRSLDEAEQRALTTKASLDTREESIRRLFDLLHGKGF